MIATISLLKVNLVATYNYGEMKTPKVEWKLNNIVEIARLRIGCIKLYI